MGRWAGGRRVPCLILEWNRPMSSRTPAVAWGIGFWWRRTTPYPTLNQALHEAMEGPAAPRVDYLPVAALLPAGRAALEKLASSSAKPAFAGSSGRWARSIGATNSSCSTTSAPRFPAAPACGWMPMAPGTGGRPSAGSTRAGPPDRISRAAVAPEARGAEDLLLGLAGDYPTPLALDDRSIGDAILTLARGRAGPGFLVFKPALFGDPAAAGAPPGAGQAAVVFSSALETAVGARAALANALRYRLSGQGPTAIGLRGLAALRRSAASTARPPRPSSAAKMSRRSPPEELWNALS